MKKISIFGAGFVGGTSYKAFSQLDDYEVYQYDKDPLRSKCTLEEACSADIIFACVPTPMDTKTGECHTGIVESVIKQIREKNTEALICIKSTVPPGTTENLNKKYRSVCFSAEFLTEANAYSDFVNQPYQVIGFPSRVRKHLRKSIVNLFRDFLIHFGHAANRQDAGLKVVQMSATELEMVKYTRNTYLATRLSFFNEIKQICENLDVDFNFVKSVAGLDKRVGNHYNVVDEDNRGWGGHCLPKDLNALKYLANSKNVKTSVLDGVWKKNLEVRKVRDWEEQEGRAVISLDKGEVDQENLN